MRIVRHKSFRKSLRFYRLVYRLAPPYKVLVDAEFVQNACAVNVDLYESLGHIFHTGPFSVWITECTRSALESGKMTPAITALLRKARSLPCGHHKDAKALAAPAPPDSDEEEEEEEESSGSDSGSGAEGSGSDDDDDDDGSDDEGSDSEEEEAAPAPSKKARGSGDAKPAPPAFPPKAAAAPVVPPPRKSKKKNTMAMLPTGYLRSPVCICQLLGVGSPGGYVVAGEDKDLKTHCRNTPGIPLIILNRTVVTLEVPSQVSREKCTDIELAKSLVTKAERKLVATAGKEGSVVGTPGPAPAGDAPKKKKKRGPREPNPLSVKKRKAAPSPAPKLEKKQGRRKHSKKARAGPE